MASETHPGSGGPPARAVVASITKYIPYPAINHAGGSYVLAQDEALADFADVHHFAPDTPPNRDALPRSPVGATLLRGVGPGGDGRFKLAWDLESAWSGSAVSWPWRRLFRTDRAPWRELANADVIEFHWSEMIALAPIVRSRLPHVPLIGIAHDVVTQRWQRAAETARDEMRRAVFTVAAARSRRREATSFSALNALVVFSDKDAALAKGLAPDVRVEVVHPGLGLSSARITNAPDGAAPVVLFTGALNRPDNARGILWFLDEVWPRVHELVPRARLIVAGANPTAELRRAAAASPAVEVTGFVDSLEPYYASASVFIAPLQTGAGVKFKTLDAMVRDVPVVTTTVGAEGIEAESLFAAVTDHPVPFADAVVRELTSPNHARTREAGHWARSIYGIDTFRRRVKDVYDSLLPTAG